MSGGEHDYVAISVGLGEHLRHPRFSPDTGDLSLKRQVSECPDGGRSLPQGAAIQLERNKSGAARISLVAAPVYMSGVRPAQAIEGDFAQAN